VKSINPHEAREQLESILSQEEYAAYGREQEPVVLNWLRAAWDWLGERFDELLPDINIPDQTADWISYAVVIAGLLLLLYFIVVFFRRFVRESRIRPKAVGTSRELSMSTQDHLTAADGSFQNGDALSALRHAFLALLLHFDQRQWVKARAWKTNGEYVDELLDSHPAVARTFSELALVFDESFYGNKTTSLAEYQAFRNKIDELIAMTLDSIPEDHSALSGGNEA
jgi:hypothetical protein